MKKQISQKGNIIVIVLVLVAVVIGGFLLFSQKTSKEQVKTQQESQILAGKQAQYMVFTKNEYEKALKSGKVVFLDFYANWCPICREEDPQFKAGFNSLTTDRVVGFRVNYNDTDTDEDEKKLAQEFGVIHQNTKFILKDGKVVFGPTLEEWDKETFLNEINKSL